MGRNCLKRGGAWTVFRFKGGVRLAEEKGEGVFLKGG